MSSAPLRFLLPAPRAIRYASRVLLLRCPTCKHALDARSAPLTCPSCNALLPPHPQVSPFALLGFDRPQFSVDDKELEKAWLSRSRVVHPDKAAKKAPAERRAAAEMTAALNDAYRLLKGPFERASFLVKHAGVAEPKLTQAQLVAFMTAREEAEEGAGARVVAESKARFAACMAEAARLLTEEDGEEAAVAYSSSSSSSRLVRVAGLLAEAKTLARLVDDLGGGKLIPSLDGR